MFENLGLIENRYGRWWWKYS